MKKIVLLTGCMAIMSNVLFAGTYTKWVSECDAKEPGTVALWHFNETSGRIAYNTAGNSSYNLAKANGKDTDWQPGKFNNCSYFHADRRFECQSNLGADLTTASIELWYNASVNKKSAVDATMFAQTAKYVPGGDNGNIFTIGYRAENKKVRVFWVVGETVNAIDTIKDMPFDSKWHHIAVTMNGKEWKLYHDGWLQGSAKSTAVYKDFVTNDPTPNPCTWVGCYRTRIGDFVWEGKLDEVRISSVVRDFAPLLKKAFSSKKFSLHNLTTQTELWGGNAKILKDEQGEYWNFDGKSNIVKISPQYLGFDPGLYSKFSMSFRIRPKTRGKASTIVGRGRTYSYFVISLRPEGQLQLAIYRNNLPKWVARSKESLPLDIWTNVRFEGDENRMYLFFNNIFQSEASLPSDKKPLLGEGPLYIGMHPSGLAGFVGDMGDFSINVGETQKADTKVKEPSQPNFVTKKEPYEYDKNTLFLAHMDGKAITTDGKLFDLINHNGSWWESGVLGKALVLSGAATYVDCGTIPLRGEKTVSLECWFYPERDMREMILFSFQTTPISYLRFCLDGNMHPYVRNSLLGKPEKVVGRHRVEPEKWHHLLAVFEPGVWTFYVDGKQSVSIKPAKSLGNLPADPKLYLGSSTQQIIGFNRFFRGAIDEVRIIRGLPAEVRLASKDTLSKTLPEELLRGKIPVYEEKNCRASIKRERGQAFIEINGEKHFPAPFVIERLYNAYAKKIAPDFQQAGTQVFITPILTRWFYSRELWTGHEKYDFSIIDRSLESTIQKLPDAYLIPQIWLSPPSREGVPPQWWEKENPEEIYKLSNGKPTQYYRAQHSYSSKKWLDDASAMLNAAIRYIEAKPYASRIIGYQLVVGPYGENVLWIHRHRDPKNQGDYSRPEIEGFRSWIKDKYGTLDNLNKAWNMKYNDWTAVTVPLMERRLATEIGVLREPARMRDVADYIRYQNVSVAQYLRHFAKVAKEACGRRKLIGAYNGYVLENVIGVNWSGHDAFNMLLRSPDIDFFSKPIEYFHRRLGETGGYHNVAASIALHGKLWIDENDIRTHLCEGEGFCGALNYADDAAVLRRGFLSALANGMGLWWMSLSGYAYGDPADQILMNEIAAIQQVGKAVLEMSATSGNHDVAIFLDETGGEYFSALESAELLKHYPWNITRTAMRAGVGFDTYLLSDFENVKLDSYKLVIFANCFEPSSQRIAMIKEYLAKGKKTAIWVYASGLYSDGLLAPKIFEDNFGISVGLRPGKPSAKIRVVSTGEEAGTSELCNNFAIEKGKDIEVMATYIDSGEIAIARKGKVVYCGLPDIGISLLREIARQAGVHIWTEDKDSVFVAPCFVGLHTALAGSKTIKLPSKAEVVFDVYEQQIIARNTLEFNVELPARYTGLYYFGPKKNISLLKLKRPVLKVEDYKKQDLESTWTYSEIKSLRVRDYVTAKEMFGLLVKSKDLLRIADKEHIVYRARYWKGPEDFSAKIVTAWNKKKFYVIVEILDDEYKPASQGRDIWKGDNVQIQIKGKDDFYLFVISPGNPIGNPHAYIYTPGRLAGVDDSKRISLDAAAVTDVNGKYKGYRLCIGIPWDLLKLEPGAGNWSIDVCPHDSDAGGTKSIGSLSNRPWAGTKPGQRCSPVKILKKK